jgi:hypothetical protein
MYQAGKRKRSSTNNLLFLLSFKYLHPDQGWKINSTEESDGPFFKFQMSEEPCKKNSALKVVKHHKYQLLALWERTLIMQHNT